MTTETGYYSLIQFCPDPAAAESVNIGLVAFCPQSGFLEVHVSKNNKRVVRTFGNGVCNQKALQCYKNGLRDWILGEREKFSSLENVQRFFAEQVNQIVFTSPRPVVWREGAEAGAIAIFNRLVEMEY